MEIRASCILGSAVLITELHSQPSTLGSPFYSQNYFKWPKMTERHGEDCQLVKFLTPDFTR
jgi:hypothetical protein